jgi:hypothetical protein
MMGRVTKHLQQLRRGQRANPCCCEFNRERDAIVPPAYLRHVRSVVIMQLIPRPLERPCHEEFHRRIRRGLRGGWAGTRIALERIQTMHVFIPDPQWLSARREDAHALEAGREPVDHTGDSGHKVLAIVDQEQLALSLQGVDYPREPILAARRDAHCARERGRDE